MLCQTIFCKDTVWFWNLFLSGQWREIHQREDSWSGAPALNGLRHSYLDIEMDCKHEMNNRNIVSCYQLLIIIFILGGNMADSFIRMWCVFYALYFMFSFDSFNDWFFTNDGCWRLSTLCNDDCCALTVISLKRSASSWLACGWDLL